MPVNYKQSVKSAEVIYQRGQYSKGGIARRYWDYRDKVILDNISKDAEVILDLGCGEGITLEKICTIFNGRRIIGIDIDNENIAICRERGLPATKGDVYHIDMPDESLDCCILSEVIEHLDDPKSAFLEIKRVLRPGGRLIVVFPNDSVFRLARIVMLKFREALYDAGHLRQWTPPDMKKYLVTLGFDIELSKSIPFFLWPISLHCVVVSVKQRENGHISG